MQPVAAVEPVLSREGKAASCQRHPATGVLRAILGTISSTPHEETAHCPLAPAMKAGADGYGRV
jgi:hypothetical protein